MFAVVQGHRHRLSSSCIFFVLAFHWKLRCLGEQTTPDRSGCRDISISIYSSSSGCLCVCEWCLIVQSDCLSVVAFHGILSNACSIHSRSNKRLRQQTGKISGSLHSLEMPYDKTIIFEDRELLAFYTVKKIFISILIKSYK